MKLILLLASCVVAAAAPVPPAIPVVKRPKPLLSPAHSAQTKNKPMVKAVTAGITDPYQPPPVPMTMKMVRETSQYGNYRFTAGSLQPPNHALNFEYSPVVGDWLPLAYFGPVPDEQYSFASARSFSETINVRARLIPIEPVPGQSQTGWMPASLVPVHGSKAYVNPNVPGGVDTWSVRK